MCLKRQHFLSGLMFCCFLLVAAAILDVDCFDGHCNNL